MRNHLPVESLVDIVASPALTAKFMIQQLDRTLYTLVIVLFSIHPCLESPVPLEDLMIGDL